jgi:hypothetical protein
MCDFVFSRNARPGLNLIKLLGAYLDAMLSQDNGIRRLNKHLKVLPPEFCQPFKTKQAAKRYMTPGEGVDWGLTITLSSLSFPFKAAPLPDC